MQMKPVDMVYDFCLKKASPKVNFHHQPVLRYSTYLAA